MNILSSSLYRDVLAVVAISLVVRALTAMPLQQPGYFDAYFYYSVAERLVQGHGFSLPILWNYLDDPQALPHPSNTYWMPLTSILAALSFSLLGISYRASQIPFIVLSAVPAILAYLWAQRVFGDRRGGWIAALLTLFSGFYLAFWVSPDTFTPFAVAGGLALFLMGEFLQRPRLAWAFFAGAAIGAAHLTRPDGVLLAGVVILVIALAARREVGRTSSWVEFWRPLLASLVGYLLVMGPWFLYNIATVGTLLPSAGIQTLFLRQYEDLFSYSPELSLNNYLAWGWGPILSSKIQAAGHNALVLLGALQFFLAPLAAWGWWQARKEPRLWPSLIYLPILYLSMTLVFTFPSMRGSMLHSTSALLPILFASVPAGVASFVRWVARLRRTWEISTAERFFSVGFVALAVLFSLLLFSQGVFWQTAEDPIAPLWNERSLFYREASLRLGVEDQDPVVMIVDPPAWYYFIHRPAIVIPADDPPVLFEVARRYGAEYLILEVDHPSALDGLYRGEEHLPGLSLLDTLEDPLGNPVFIYRITISA